VAKADDTAAALPDVRLPATSIPYLPTPSAAAPPPPRPAPPPVVQSQPQAATAPTSAERVIPRVVRTDPEPLRAITAAWPRNTARAGPVEVQIRVQIDAQGRVSSAIPLNRNVRNFAYVDSALTAARLWTFSPALENGRPVPSESVLTFKFTP